LIPCPPLGSSIHQNSFGLWLPENDPDSEIDLIVMFVDEYGSRPRHQV
jgi:hypothetical protein